MIGKLICPALLVFGQLFAGSALAGDRQQWVTLVTDPWPPFVLGELGQEATGGIGFELMHNIFDRIDNTALSIPLVPWNRALRDVKNGTEDGIGIILKTPAREVYLDYTDEIFRSHNALWFTADQFPNGFDWQTYDDFKPYSIGIVRGHSYGQQMDQAIADGTLNTITLTSTNQLFKMLDKGRIDLVMVNFHVGSAFAEQYASTGKQLRASQKSLSAEVFYIAFSKKSTARHLIPTINKVVEQLKHEGAIEALFSSTNPTATTQNSH